MTTKQKPLPGLQLQNKSTWYCNNPDCPIPHEDSFVDWTWADVAVSGTPCCHGCDSDLVLSEDDMKQSAVIIPKSHTVVPRDKQAELAGYLILIRDNVTIALDGLAKCHIGVVQLSALATVIRNAQMAESIYNQLNEIMP